VSETTGRGMHKTNPVTGEVSETEKAKRIKRAIHRLKTDPNYGRQLMGLPPLPKDE